MNVVYGSPILLFILPGVIVCCCFWLFVIVYCHGLLFVILRRLGLFVWHSWVSVFVNVCYIFVFRVTCYFCYCRLLLLLLRITARSCLLPRGEIVCYNESPHV